MACDEEDYVNVSNLSLYKWPSVNNYIINIMTLSLKYGTNFAIWRIIERNEE